VSDGCGQDADSHLQQGALEPQPRIINSILCAPGIHVVLRPCEMRRSLNTFTLAFEIPAVFFAARSLAL